MIRPPPGSTLFPYTTLFRSSSTGRDVADFVVADDIQTVVWLANLAALELHVPQWRIGLSDDGRDPQADLIVFDLDPGPGATIVECCDVALALRELLSHYGMEGWPKTSGNKGMHLYVPIEPASSRKTSAFAKQLAEQLAEALPENVTANMTKALRPGKVFIDWSQNASAKTTLAPYSLRGAEEPRVSTPIDWDEVASATAPDRKSTRLNSSHVEISYAVFCLKKKKKTIIRYKIIKKNIKQIL